MVIIVESPSQFSMTPSPAATGYASSSTSHASETTSQRPSTPKQLMQSLLGGRSSPFRGLLPSPSGGVLSRHGSLRSSSRDCPSSGRSSKRNSQAISTQDDDSQLGADVVMLPAAAPELPKGAANAFSSANHAPVPSSPIFHQFEETLGSPMVIVHSLFPSSDPPSVADSGFASPGMMSTSSTTSTLSVEAEDRISTRSLSPFDSMLDSQSTMAGGSVAATPEDLPESLRLMRVAQRQGVKVIDFAFEDEKRHGEIEAWAWEGGAACKGFGIGFGGGAYNGPLKKYRPPRKEDTQEESEEDDRMMVIDDRKPNKIFSPPSPQKKRPASIFSTPPNPNRSIDRPLNSPGLPQTQTASALSGSDFAKYLQERRVAATAAMMLPTRDSEAVGVKRDRSFASAEPSKDDCSPFKKRSLG